MQTEQVASFEAMDLQTIEAECKNAADAAERAARTAGIQRLNAGRLLRAAKSKVGHGEWEPWLEAHFITKGRSVRTARAWMKFAQEVDSGNATPDESLRKVLNLDMESKSAALPISPAANLTGADVQVSSEEPIATPNDDGEETASAGATKPERQSTGKPGSEPAEEEAELPASSDGGQPKTSTNTLSGDSITEPPVVRFDQIGVDFPTFKRAFGDIVRLDMTDEERRKMVRLVETELLRKLKEQLPTDERPRPKRFKRPTLEQVREYCNERGNNVDPEAWMDFYTSKGWMVGKNKMKDWQAAVRTWEKSDRQDKAELSRVRGTDWSQYDD